MDESERLSALIGGIYDATLDPSLWPGILKRSAEFFRGWSAGILSKDPASKSAAMHFTDGRMDPYYAQLYFEKYVKLDPCSTAHYFGEIDQPLSTSDMLSPKAWSTMHPPSWTNRRSASLS